MALRLKMLGSTEFKSLGNFVKGRLKRGSGALFDVKEPRNGTILVKYNDSTAEDVNEATSIARESQVQWASLSSTQRGDVLWKTAQLIEANCEELAKWESLDNGKPISEARMDVMSCVDTFKYFSACGQSLVGQYIPLPDGRFAFTSRQPIGVVGCIGAWNYPIQTCSWKTAPALACGNSVVYKPSPLCPISALLLGTLLKEAGLPDGVFNVIQGGGDTGRCLVEHPYITKVSFTGSISTGQMIMKSCAARNIKPVTLELGGKSALVVCADADIDSAVAGAMIANFYSQGQVCSNASKVLVHKSIYDDFKKKLVDRTAKMVVGDPLKEDVKVGAHISLEHLQKVKSYIDGAVREGATVVHGGNLVAPIGMEGGYYLSPCILEDITPNMSVYKDEIFGSVLLLIPYDTTDDAVGMANDTNMGLAAGVFTKDHAAAYEIASSLNAGNVYVNTYNDVSPFVPFGGFGQSGFGRENGTAVLEHYTQVKSTFVNTKPLDNPF